MTAASASAPRRMFARRLPNLPGRGPRCTRPVPPFQGARRNLMRAGTRGREKAAPGARSGFVGGSLASLHVDHPPSPARIRRGRRRRRAAVPPRLRPLLPCGPARGIPGLRRHARLRRGLLRTGLRPDHRTRRAVRRDGGPVRRARDRRRDLLGGDAGGGRGHGRPDRRAADFGGRGVQGRVRPRCSRLCSLWPPPSSSQSWR